MTNYPSNGDDIKKMANHKIPETPGTREFSFPLMDGVATLRVPHPMGEANYNLLKAILDATKVALIGPKVAPPTDPPSPLLSTSSRPHPPPPSSPPSSGTMTKGG